MCVLTTVRALMADSAGAHVWAVKFTHPTFIDISVVKTAMLVIVLLVVGAWVKLKFVQVEMLKVEAFFSRRCWVATPIIWVKHVEKVTLLRRRALTSGGASLTTRAFRTRFLFLGRNSLRWVLERLIIYRRCQLLTFAWFPLEILSSQSDVLSIVKVLKLNLRSRLNPCYVRRFLRLCSG